MGFNKYVRGGYFRTCAIDAKFLTDLRPPSGDIRGSSVDVSKLDLSPFILEDIVSDGIVCIVPNLSPSRSSTMSRPRRNSGHGSSAQRTRDLLAGIPRLATRISRRGQRRDEGPILPRAPRREFYARRLTPHQKPQELEPTEEDHPQIASYMDDREKNEYTSVTKTSMLPTWAGRTSPIHFRPPTIRWRPQSRTLTTTLASKLGKAPVRFSANERGR